MVTQPGRRSAAAFAAFWLAVIALVTLWPANTPETLPASCIFCGQLGGVDFVLNIVLFIPFGLGLRWLLGNWRTPVIVGAATTLAIEMLQWRQIPGRDASLGDLLANAIGTMLGAWLAVAVLRWLMATGAAARRLTTVWGLIAAAVITVSATLLQPFPTKSPLWVQWVPQRPHMDVFQGQLNRVELNGLPISRTDILTAARLLDTATHGVAVRVEINGSIPPTERRAYIVRTASALEEGFALSQRGDALLFRTNTLAARLKLRTITVELANAFPAAGSASNGEADLARIEARSVPEAMVVSNTANGYETSVALRRTVGLAWALLVPWDITLGPSWWPANAAWLAALLIPVAFLTSRTARRLPDEPARRVMWWPLALVLVTMIAAPAITGAALSGAGEWLGVLIGLAAGAWLERLVTSAAPR